MKYGFDDAGHFVGSMLRQGSVDCAALSLLNSTGGRTAAAPMRKPTASER
jgi:hypothetical protein